MSIPISQFTVSFCWNDFTLQSPPNNTIAGTYHKISEYLNEESGLANEILSYEKINIILNNVRKHMTFEQRIKLNQLLNRFVIFCNEHYNLDVALLPIIIRPPRDKSIIPLHFHPSTNHLMKWWQQCFQPFFDVESSHFDAISDKHLIQLTILSAAIHGGLINRDFLSEFANRIVSSELEVDRCNHLFWIELKAPKGQVAKLPTNIFINGTAAHMRRFFFDTITLSLLNRLRERKLNEKLMQDYLAKFIDDDKRLVLLSLLDLNSASEHYTSRLKENEVQRGLAALFDHIHCDQLPAAMVTYLNTETRSLCTDHASFISLFKYPKKLPANQIDHRVTENYIDPEEFQLTSPTYHQNNSLQGVNISQAVAILRTILSRHPKQVRFWVPNNSGKHQEIIFGYGRVLDHHIHTQDEKQLISKQDTKIILSQLGQLLLLQGNTSEALKLIIQWYQYHLISLQNKPSTVSTYHSIVFSNWFYRAHELQLTAMSSQDIFDLYLDLIMDAQTVIQSTLSKKLLQFHQYLVEYHQFSALSQRHIRALRSFQNEIHTKTALVSEIMFQELMLAVDQAPSLCPMQKEKCKIAYLLAYRGGLRMSEALSLRIQEINLDANINIVIRNNRFGQLKSQSSYRSGSLGLLLTPSEKEFFINFHAYVKQTYSSEKDALFISNQHLSISPELLNQLIKGVMQPYGIYATFHSLRHTAISRMHMILSGAIHSLPYLNPYAAELIEKIQHYFLSKNKQMNTLNWELASFAGHRSPEMTFTSYLHLNQILIYDISEKAHIPLSNKTLANYTGLSLRKVVFAHKKTPRLCPNNLRAAVIANLTLPVRNFTPTRPEKKLITYQVRSLKTPSKAPQKNTFDVFVNLVRNLTTNKSIQPDQIKYLESIGCKKQQIIESISSLNNLNIKALPSESLSTQERELIDHLITCFNYNTISSIKTSPALTKLVRSYWRHKVNNQSYLKFYDFKTLKQFVDLIAPIHVKQWHMKVYAANQTTINQWKQQLSKELEIAPSECLIKPVRHQQGYIYLSLRHPNETERLKNISRPSIKHFSSSSLYYFIFYSTCLLLALEYKLQL